MSQVNVEYIREEVTRCYTYEIYFQAIIGDEREVDLIEPRWPEGIRVEKTSTEEESCRCKDLRDYVIWKRARRNGQPNYYRLLLSNSGW